MSVTFCGHGDISYNDEIKHKLQTEIENVIKDGETDFLLGGYGRFDLLAAHTLKILKSEYPQIKSMLVLPYINKEYDTALYDESIYPPLEKVHKRVAIIKRNEWAVNEANIVIAYVDHDWGGAAKTLKYAVKRKKDIRNISRCNVTTE